MHILVVLDHPNPNSFSAAAAEAFSKGAQSASHTVEFADLHAENFDPRWTMADIRAEGNHQIQGDIEREHRRIERADAICFVFPLFWWGMPSMTKGWLDRVWSWGWAYDQLDDPEQSMQRKRTGLLLIPAGTRSDEIQSQGYAAAMETAWIKGTLGYFGFSPRRMELLCGSTGSLPRRKALLDHCIKLGRTMPPPSDSAAS